VRLDAASIFVYLSLVVDRVPRSTRKVMSILHSVSRVLWMVTHMKNASHFPTASLGTNNDSQAKFQIQWRLQAASLAVY
jgi:hypothetical protein